MSDLVKKTWLKKSQNVPVRGGVKRIYGIVLGKSAVSDVDGALFSINQLLLGQLKLIKKANFIQRVITWYARRLTD